MAIPISARPDTSPPLGGGAIVCDDLSGACESAGVLRMAGYPATVFLGARSHTLGPGGRVAVIDLDLRDRLNGDAAAAIEHASATFDIAYIKVDSLLRGPIQGIVAGALATGRTPLFCSALPGAGRTVVDDEPFVNGIPLAATSTWQLEPTEPPRSVSGMLAPILTRRVDGATAEPEPGTVLLGDAANDTDLDRLAALASAAGLLPIGSAGMLSATVRHLGRPVAAEIAPHVEASPCRGGGSLIVVGTASAAAYEQTKVLHSRGALVIDLDPSAVGGSDLIELDAIEGPVVVRWRRHQRPAPCASKRLDAYLADMVANTIDNHPGVPLVLTGGRTARTVLDRLGVERLDTHSVVHHGAVIATTDTGHVVAVRPGSFGDRESLASLSDAVTSFPPRRRIDA